MDLIFVFTNMTFLLFLIFCQEAILENLQLLSMMLVFKRASMKNLSIVINGLVE